MKFVSLEDFQKYSGVFNDNPIQETFIETSQDIIENYLGYKLELQRYESYINGNNSNEASLKAKPVKRLIKVTINGKDTELDNFTVDNEFLIYKNIFPEGNKNILIVYEAGYDSPNIDNFGNLLDCGDSESEIDGPVIGCGNASSSYENIIDSGGSLFKNIFNYLPEIIKSSILRIAALLQSESDSNTGITSKSFGDSGSRTFINYTNFDKYLSPISNYRLLRI